MSAIEADRRLHGQPGSMVTVSLIRGRTQEPFDITLEREINASLQVTGRLFDTTNEIGIVRIPSFHDDVATQVSEVITSLTTRGASVCPTNIFADMLVVSAPLVPIVFCIIFDINFMIF